VSTPTAEADRPGRRTLVLISIYVAWCALGYSVLLSSDPRYLWHVPLHALAALMLWKPSLLRPRRARPKVIHFVLVGVAYSAFIGEPLAILGRGDLHPDLLVNSLLWLGSFAGIHLAWAWLLTRYRWRPTSLFLLCGLATLFDPSLLLWRFLRELDVIGFLLIAPVLHAVYASMTAPVVIAYREALARRPDRPGIGAHALAAMLPGVLFRIGSLWIGLAGMVIRLAG